MTNTLAIIKPVGEEDVEGVMHQFCETHYGAVIEETPHPFMVMTDAMLIWQRVLLLGMKPIWSH